MIRFGTTPDEDLIWTRALEQGRQRAASAAALWRQSDAAFAAQIAGAAPWLNAGTALALAKGQASPEAIEAAAKAAAAQRAQLPNVPRGARIRGAELLPGHRKLIEDDARWATPGALRRSEFNRDVHDISPEDMEVEAHRDVAAMARHSGENIPTTEAQAQWQGGMDVAEQLRREGLLDDNNSLVSPVSAPSNFLNDDGEIDEGKLATLEPDQAQRFRRFVEIVDQISGGEDDVPYVEPDGETGRFDPQTRSFVTHIAGVNPVNPFDLGGAVEPAVDILGKIPLPSVGEAFSGLRSGSQAPGSGRPRGAPPVDQQTAGIQMPTSIRELGQTAGIIANAPVQEFQGQIRNIYGSAIGRDVDWWEPQSDLGIMAGTDMEPGDGWLVDPDSEVAQERLRREAERGEIYGQRITAGRIVAGGLTRAGVIEPGSGPYRILSGLVDGAIQVADPSATTAGAWSKGFRARTLFRAGEEIAENIAERPQVATAELRSLASRFGVRGREGMAREELVTVLASQAPAQMTAMNVGQLRNLAARFNIPGRTSMARADLVTSLGERFRTLDATDIPNVPGPSIPASSVPRTLAAGLADGTRVTGIPFLARHTGLIKGDFTDGIHGPTTEFWLNGREGTGIRKAIAETTDPLELDFRTGFKLEPGELAALLDTRTADEVTDVLRPMLGATFRRTNEVWKDLGASVPIYSQLRNTNLMPEMTHLVEEAERVPGSTQARSLAGQARAAIERGETQIPGSYIDLDDPRSSLNETRAWMRNAHFTDEEIAPYYERLIRATDRNEVFNVVEDVMQATDGVLARAGVGRADRTRMTRLWREEHAEAQRWFLGESTEQQSLFNEVDVGLPNAVPTGNPQEFMAAYNRFIHLPDFREVRRVTSKYPNIAWNASGQLRKPTSMLMGYQEEIWKPFTLLRLAWPVRVIAEEQLRMAAADWTSVFKDPLSYIGFAIARKTDVKGTMLDNIKDFQRAGVTRTDGWLNDRPGRVRSAQSTVYARGDKGYEAAVGNRLVQLHDNPIARRIADGNSEDEIVEWATRGEGQAYYNTLRDEHPEMFTGALDNEVGLRQHINNVSRWNQYITGGNEDLLAGIRTGVIPGKGRVGSHVNWKIQSGDGLPSPHLTRAIAQRFSDATPAEIAGYRDLAETGYRSVVTERLFGWMMAKPTTFLSRNPTWKQAYQDRLVELVNFGSPQAKEDLLAWGAETERIGMKAKGLGRDVPNLSGANRAAIERTVPAGRLTLEEMDAYAKGHALDEVKRLLYDMSERSQFFDSNRLLFPFGEAWKEVITRWGKDLANPFTARGWKSLRRFQQVAQGARGSDFGELAGAPEGEGFFHQDEFGEWQFLYPGSQYVNGAITDMFGEPIPVPLSGKVEGLSMFGNVIPGIGPVAAIPVAAFIQDEPGWQREARSWLLPFGHPSESGGLSAVTQALSYAPPWMRHGVTALMGGGYNQETNRIYANAELAAMNYYYSTGNYDTSNASGRLKLRNDAAHGARLLTAVRALSSFGAPAAPAIEFMTETNEGAMLTSFLRDDYYRLVDEEGYENADSMFLERWGDQAGMVMQAMTREVTRGIEPTTEFRDWTNSDEGRYMKDNYSHIWGFFGPGGGEFDAVTYREQIYAGDRETLSDEEYLNAGQNHLGQMLLDDLNRALGPRENWSESDEAQAREITAMIHEEYPGFQDYTGTDQRATREQILTQIQEALEDDRVLDTETGHALGLYMEARNAVLDHALDMGLAAHDVTYDLRRANSLAEDREILFSIGEEIATKYPDFSRVWDRQLRYEVMGEEG